MSDDHLPQSPPFLYQLAIQFFDPSDQIRNDRGAVPMAFAITYSSLFFPPFATHNAVCLPKLSQDRQRWGKRQIRRRGKIRAPNTAFVNLKDLNIEDEGRDLMQSSI